MTTPAISRVGKTGYNQVTMPRLSPEQQQLFSQVIGGIQPGLNNSVSQLSQLASGGSPEMWEQLEAPALRQFNELQGGLASRFSGMGSGARRSSGFQNTSNTAAQSLSESLQSQRLGLQQGAIDQLLSLYGNIMGTDVYDRAFVPKKQKGRPFWQELLGNSASSLGPLAFLGLF